MYNTDTDNIHNHLTISTGAQKFILIVVYIGTCVTYFTDPDTFKQCWHLTVLMYHGKGEIIPL